jgi:mannan endo-1,4-beta-mannosidase
VSLQGFVGAEPDGFVIGDKPFPVVGVNCYFLAYCSDSSRQAVMDTVLEMGANTVRSWAFLDVDSRAPGAPAFQYLNSGSITIDGGPDGLERLDALIESAEANGVRLILPLINYWENPLGGMLRYLQWLGIPGGVDQFYRSAAARAAYQDWVRAVLTRQNTRTGRMYYAEPAIMAWELANEPRCEVQGGRELLLDWIGEMSRFVKSLDPNHLLAVGDEGYLKHAQTHDDLYDGSHGVDGEAILNFGEIDFGTFHFYPESMNRAPQFLDTWIRDHVGSGQRANKPMLLEEYGIKINGTFVGSAKQRNDWYARWLDSVRRYGAAGDLLWMVGGSAPDTAGFRDDYTVLSAAEVPAVKDHADEMVLLT